MIPPQQQPDIAGAVHALDQAMIALAVAKSTLLGETSRPIHASERDLAAAQASPANPYGSTKHGRYDAESAAEAGKCGAEDAMEPGWWVCTMPAGHYGDHVAQDEDGNTLHAWPGEPVPHLPQHKGGLPECTAPGCGQPGHHLHAASIPGDGA